MSCRRVLIFAVASLMSLTGCYGPTIEGVEPKPVAALNGDTADVCLDPRVTPATRGYIDFSNLPDLTKATLENEQPNAEGLSLWLRDNHTYEAVGQKLAPMRRCWNDGDPRDNGLYRYGLSLSGDKREGSYMNYWVYFDGDRMVYAEGWI